MSPAKAFVLKGGLVGYALAVTTGLPALSTTASMACCRNAAPASRITSKPFDQNAARPLRAGAFLPRLSALRVTISLTFRQQACVFSFVVAVCRRCNSGND
jgi:hypothetical protein